MKAIIFDTETTGLWANRLKKIEKQPYIVEFFGEKIDVESENVLEELHSWFRAPVKMDAGAAKVTGLTEEFLADKPLFGEKIDEIEKFFEDSQIIIGQNVMFDITMMNFEFKRNNKKFNIDGKKIIDLVEATEYIFGYRCKLGDLYEHLFGERFSNAHEASADVKATTKIYLELLKRGDI